MQTRREFIAQVGAAAAAGWLGSRLAEAQQVAGLVRRMPAGRSPVVMELVATQGQQQILPGAPTSVWSYRAQLLKGPPGTLTPVPNSYLGPIIKVRTGQPMRIRLRNEITEDHITHWHGLDVPEAADGHPRFVFGPGQYRDYDFTVTNRAGTYWYHPHPHGRTGHQANMGLAGFFIVTDEEEQSLPLPRGAYDIPLCIQDRSFDANNQFTYLSNMMEGFLGDQILINGQPDFSLSLETRIYRLRLLNGSASRIYKLAFSDGTPMIVIGTDGGLLPAPIEYPYVMLSPGERVELWADFSQHPVGSQLTLRSLGFSGAGGAQGTPLDLMTISIDQASTETLTLPDTLASFTPYSLDDAINPGNPRQFPIAMQPGQGFTLNGGLFQMEAVAPNEIVTADTLELIEISNTSGIMQVAHPMHFHGRQFQILDRSVLPGNQADWQTVSAGYVDAGWKDTFLVMPGETVRLLLRYSTHTGLFLYHCHNLVHEDDGMMRNYRIDP